MFMQRFIGKYPGWTNFRQVSAERALQYAILLAAKINMVVRCKYIQVFTTGIIMVIANTTITLDTAVHFMVNERPQVLIGVSSFFEMIAAVIVAGHYCHILQ